MFKLAVVQTLIEKEAGLLAPEGPQAFGVFLRTPPKLCHNVLTPDTPGKPAWPPKPSLPKPKPEPILSVLGLCLNRRPAICATPPPSNMWTVY